MAFYLELEDELTMSRAVLSLDILRFSPSRRIILSDRIDLSGRYKQFELEQEIPYEDEVSIVFVLNMLNIDGSLQVGATASYLEGARFNMPDRWHADISLIHGYGPRLTQCTVFCPSSGESRTGPKACIDCRSAEAQVRICC